MVQHGAPAAARRGARGPRRAALPRCRRDAALRCDLSFRPSRCAQLTSLEDGGEHAVDRTHAAAFPRSAAHRCPPLHACYLIVLSLLDRKMAARAARCLSAATAMPVNRQIATMSICSMFSSRERARYRSAAICFAPADGVVV